MKLSVYDTYVKMHDGNTLHFDILVPQDKYNFREVSRFGEAYMQEVGVQCEVLTAQECKLCLQVDPTAEALRSIEQKGYHIVPFDNIPRVLPENPSRTQLIQHLRANREEWRFENFQLLETEKIRGLVLAIEGD